MIFGRGKERETAALKVSVRHRVCRTRTHCLCSAAHLVGSQPATSASAADLLQFQNPGSDTVIPTVEGTSFLSTFHISSRSEITTG